MTATLGTNSQNDLYLGPDGNLVLLLDVPAIVAACKSACLTQLGECVLQTGIGLPNFQLIWVGSPDYAMWQTFLENTLLAVDGVASVQSIALFPEKNVLNYRAQITTIFGPTTVNGTLIGSGANG